MTLYLLSLNVFANDKVLTFGTILFPPSTSIEEGTGKCIGSNIDKAVDIFQHLNITVDIVCTSPIRIYRMLENNEIDVTINIKSTTALAPYVEFTDIPFRQLRLNLYQYKDVAAIQSISAVRGFDYNGHRQKYAEQNVEFFNLPNTISAIQVFARKRSDALLSYQDPMDHYIKVKGIDLGGKITVTRLLTLDSYIAINKRSPHFNSLKSSLNDLAKTRDLKYFINFDK